ncbi:RdgB/HAM1 family non-canonical purine NTP pyrophosphatase [Angustibacter sp. McL0619]|uniref:RdgB/HAM1 family non-canonical purine NTP pyrophosphatase n=1 Tax=Angustibacter sp. McL0619 TaxID=3415676 RepID=UPI003CE6B33D
MSAPQGARLVLATHNPHKVAELREILADVLADRGLDVDLDRAVVGAGDFPGLGEPVEDGDSFAANALIKARAVCAATGLPALADDSGLAVDILGGSPGIFSARWSGKPAGGADRGVRDRANVVLLLEQLDDVLDEHRGAGFVCAVALVTPSGGEHVEHGEVRGVLAREPQGDNGFGYDPILQVDPERTLAQFSNAEKNAISHRGRALRAIAPRLVDLLVADVSTS